MSKRIDLMRKRSALMRMCPPCPDSTASEDRDATSTAEDLSFKMSRLHSPMKTDSAAAEPRAAPVVRPLNMSGCICHEITEVTAASTGAAAATIPKNTLVPHQAVRRPGLAPVPRHGAAGTGAGTGTSLVSTVPGTLVRQDPGRIMLGWSGTILTGAEYAQIKLEQRNTQNYWKTEWAFPTGDICEHFSLKRALEFVCWGMHGSIFHSTG